MRNRQHDLATQRERGPGRSASMIAALVILAGVGRARAQDMATGRCPDPAPLYALRSLEFEQRGWQRLLRLRQRRGDFAPPRAHLIRLWPARGSTCAQAVAEVLYTPDGCTHGGVGCEDIEHHVLEASPRRQGLAMPVGRAAENDWRVVADPRLPDVDGDGIAESLALVPPDDAASREIIGGEPPFDLGIDPDPPTGRCWIPGIFRDQVRGSRGAMLGRPFQSHGRVPNPQFDARARAALRRWSGDGPCPALGMQWQKVETIGEEHVRRSEGGFAIDRVLRRSQCRGWEDPDGADGQCSDASDVFETIVYEGGAAHVQERPYSATGVDVSAGCGEGCRVTAVPWSFPDGDRTPHRIPVELTRDERARPVGTLLPGGRGVRLSPGIYAVEVAAGRDRTVWQVWVAPSDDAPIRLIDRPTATPPTPSPSPPAGAATGEAGGNARFVGRWAHRGAAEVLRMTLRLSEGMLAGSFTQEPTEPTADAVDTIECGVVQTPSSGSAQQPVIDFHCLIGGRGVDQDGNLVNDGQPLAERCMVELSATGRLAFYRASSSSECSIAGRELRRQD